MSDLLQCPSCRVGLRNKDGEEGTCPKCGGLVKIDMHTKGTIGATHTKDCAIVCFANGEWVAFSYKEKADELHLFFGLLAHLSELHDANI